MFFKKKFSPAKCKTALRLAISRIKLLRNMRDVQLKKLKRELISLLKANQEASAHLKVEHIHREQNIMAAYAIIELLCQQIINRLPIIEAQKECPIDVQEAVGTIIYAAPYCSDIPELQTLRRFLSAKYGKEFTAIAAELRKDCKVNRVVIENLSTRRPSVEVKLNLMKSTADELNVDWDPTYLRSQLLGHRENLLKGQTEFDKGQRMLPGVLSEGYGQCTSSHHNGTSALAKALTPFARSLFLSSKKQSTSDEVDRPLSGSLSKEQISTAHMKGSFDGTSHVASTMSQTLSHEFEERTNFKKIVLAARKAAESAERAAAAARAALAIAGQNHDEIWPDTDNERDNDCGEDVQKSNFVQNAVPMMELYREGGSCRDQDPSKQPLCRNEFSGHLATPSVISIEHTTDSDTDDDDCNDDFVGSHFVSSASHIPGEHGRIQMSSQRSNTGVCPSKPCIHQHGNVASEKQRPETAGSPSVFDTEELDDTHNENADQAAPSINAWRPVQRLSKLPQRQTSSVISSQSFTHQTAPFTKSTSFVHPKLPDFDDLVAYFKALKAKNTKK